jgi:hypothetical protein
MAIEQVLYKLLTDDSTVSGLVGTRIYPQFVPQGASMPAITYQQISGIRDFTHSGPVDLASLRFQVNCWSLNYTQARALADAVRTALNGVSGKKVTGQNSDKHHIYVIILAGEVDLTDLLDDVKGSRRFGKALDFIIWCKEATE